MAKKAETVTIKIDSSAFYVHQAQIDGVGGKAHRYKSLEIYPDYAKRHCGQIFLKDQLSVASAEWPRCRRCQKMT